jgi:phosphoglycolate phosphatase-like HAD superfamily hydrolase
VNALTRHILFDFDGTIADSLELSLQIVNVMANKYTITAGKPGGNTETQKPCPSSSA